WVWEHVAGASALTWQVAGAVALGGAAWGVAVFFSLEEALSRFDGGGHLGLLSTVLALAGGAVGAALAIPAFGLAGGRSLALIATVALGLTIPLLMVLGADLGS